MEGPRSAGRLAAETVAGEAGVLSRIALPLIAAYLAEVAMFLTTKVVVGRLGYEELAAVGLSGEIAMELLFVAMGVLSIVGVLVAQAEGSGATTAAGHATRQGLLLATLVALPGTLAVWNLDWVMKMTGQDPKVVELAGPYLRAASGFMLPALWFAVLRGFVAALARTGAVMVISVAAVGLNYVLTVGLVHGAFSLPELGVAGAGWALTIVTWAMFAALAVYIYFSPPLRGYGLFRARLRIDPAVCAEIIRLGIPVAGVVIFEAGLFLAIPLLSGTFGAVALATVEILFSWISVTFVIGLGFAEAAMVRVAMSVGRANAPAARRAGLTGMTVGVCALVAFVVPPLVAPEWIVRLFLAPRDPGFDAVVNLASGLFLVVAIFQVFDGLQAIAVRALRGFKDTLVPLWIAGFGYWGLGIGGGCLLAFPLQMGVTGLWWGLAAGIIATGTSLAWRFVYLSGKPPGNRASK